MSDLDRLAEMAERAFDPEYDIAGCDVGKILAVASDLVALAQATKTHEPCDQHPFGAGGRACVACRADTMRARLIAFARRDLDAKLAEVLHG